MKIKLYTTGVKVTLDDLDCAIKLMFHVNMKGFPSVVTIMNK